MDSDIRIKIALTLADVRQVDVAKHCGVSPGFVSAVVNGRTRSRKVERRIARLTGVKASTLWPEWYGPKPKPEHPDPSAVAAKFDAIMAATQEAA